VARHIFCISIAPLSAGMIFGAPAPAGVATETVRFHTGAGEFSGTLHLPDEADRPAPLLICYHAASGGSASFPFYDHLETDLPEAGIATFLWDRRGIPLPPEPLRWLAFQALRGLFGAVDGRADRAAARGEAA